ncbi:ArsO family NAD(P)H-dependent flavin-containing monooxygenase [Flammeovirga agarivorans]|uniref:NAD(P)/FAD-dependent oxidoreductase n=1 Tax=Flammeovirga agarivorans TaxID=2726742 RepID=A0A7X8XWJ2_9BACT|nr:ArsO family NAD(P)H-dependent flavin-containing monooxygenase [Flammeovirga agarivorans]NLR92150.1 NAD(P)/FAD-dependent oxidoreductase [Flammeovirga agarivorans]
MDRKYDVVIIGGGQTGLSVAYFLHRYKINFLILDENEKAGGSWSKGWDSLQLFSPGIYSSLSGWMLPPPKEIKYPSREEFIDYLDKYEQRYGFPIERPVTVQSVKENCKYYTVETTKGEIETKVVISCTGATSTPYIPKYEGMRDFKGQLLHSYYYRNPDQLKGNKILIIGGGNSGAQIVSEVSRTHDVQWATRIPPRFLPDEVDGRYLFDSASQTEQDKNEHFQDHKDRILSDIVMLESVKEAKKRGDLTARKSNFSFVEDGVIWHENNEHQVFDAVIWCTGFKPNFSFLNSLDIVQNHKIETEGTRVLQKEGLWAVGYGNWTGFASATIHGVGKTAEKTAEEVIQYLMDFEDFVPILDIKP